MNDWGGWLDHEAKPADAEFNATDDSTVGAQVNVNYGPMYFTSPGPLPPPEEKPGSGAGAASGLAALAQRRWILPGIAIAGAAAAAVVLFTTLSGGPQKVALTHNPQYTATPQHTAATGSPKGAAWCRASAAPYPDQDHKFDIFINSNQPYTQAEARADGVANFYGTDVNGDAVIWLNNLPAGARVTVTVGRASCTTIT